MSRTKLIQVLFIYLFFYLLTGISIPAYSNASEPDENVLLIQNAYKNIKDMKGSFTQKSTIKDLDRIDEYKGDFFIKYPMMMKCIYKETTSQEITINDDTLLIYNKDNNQAYKTSFNKATYGQTPVSLLSGFGNIEEEFNISSKGNSLFLIPKKPLGNINSIIVNISEKEFPISSFTIKDNHSNVIEIKLTDIKVNVGLDNALFELSLPEKVNMFDHNP